MSVMQKIKDIEDEVSFLYGCIAELLARVPACCLRGAKLRSMSDFMRVTKTVSVGIVAEARVFL